MNKYKDIGGILVIAEHDGSRLHRVTFELLGIAERLSEKKNMPVSCLFVGPDNVDLAELGKRGAEKVFCMISERFAVPEEMLYKDNMIGFIREARPEILLFGATNFGRSLAPRIAAGLKTGLTADCTDFDINEEGRLVQVRPAFSDNIFAHIQTVRDPQMATARYKEFKEAEYDENGSAEMISVMSLNETADGVISVIETSLKDADISEAEVVVSAGRGVKRAEDLEMIRELARLLGGQMGVSRALVDAGMANSDIQVGYSGHRVKPRLYIAIGVSGAPQHLAGMKESDTIIAVNSDPSAPIFRIADIGCVGDLYEVVPQLIEYLKNRRK